MLLRTMLFTRSSAALRVSRALPEPQGSFPVRSTLLAALLPYTPEGPYPSRRLFTRAQHFTRSSAALHAQRALPEPLGSFPVRSTLLTVPLLYTPEGPYPSRKALSPCEAHYSQLCCLTRPKGLTLAAGSLPVRSTLPAALLLYTPEGPYPSRKALYPCEALYPQLCCFTRPKGLTLAAGSLPVRSTLPAALLLYTPKGPYPSR